MHTKCKERNRAGEPCSALHYRDGYCRWHHPDLETQRQAERAAGGQSRSNRARARKQLQDSVMSITDLDGLLCGALLKVATGRLEPGIGTAMAGLARTIVTIRTSGELERRLTELEAAANLDGANIRRFGA